MIPYLLIFLFAAILFIGGDRIKMKWPWYAFLIVTILFAGFRDMIGGYDIYIYSQLFEVDYRLTLAYTGFEEGFRVLTVFFKLFSDKREFFIFVTSALMMLLHFNVIKKNSPLPYFSIFIYFCKFYLFSFVYMRQGIAMGVIWLSIPYIIKKEYLNVLPFVLIAFSLHHSALIFLPMVLLSNRKFTNFQLISSVICFLILFLSPLGQMATKVLGDVTANNKLSGYAGGGGGTFNFFTIIEISGFILLAIFFKRYFYQNRISMLIYNGFILYIVISIIGVPNATFARLAWYYFIFVVLAITYMFSFLSDFKLRTAFKTLIFAYYTSMFLRLLIVWDGGDFMPYKTIFQDFPRHGRWEFMEYRKNKDM